MGNRNAEITVKGYRITNKATGEILGECCAYDEDDALYFATRDFRKQDGTRFWRGEVVITPLDQITG